MLIFSYYFAANNFNQTTIYSHLTVTGKKDKRGLVALSDGSIVDEALLSPELVDEKEDDVLFQESLMSGLAGVVGNLPVQNLQKQTVSNEIAL